ncbi:MAG: MCP four helix bundle domain-containing protein [Reichenbachiella sp.]|uniref:MCP four helix bundle domain-containing protein n=1 Tax=Reichenbachiella sp. TaxID=2184521 RepID=UPI0029664D2C|nr:MCP four helix bundle domain-containing protein [Reichenbachiella sp.]MDW3210609.1 MCP four helix bundle domain-containing protein [Reichenbachiella sp.]
MKWTYSIEQKVKAASSLAIVFLLVLATNLLDRNHFSELQESFSSVYKDRLLVENYIFKLSGLVHQKHMLLHSSEENIMSSNDQLKINQKIDALLVEYEKTKYTAKETRLFQEFKTKLLDVRELESQFQKDSNSITLRGEIEKKHLQLITLLEGLSNIQMEEGERLINQSNDVIKTSHSISRIEIIILICMGIFAQALILASKTLKPKKPQNFNLN